MPPYRSTALRPRVPILSLESEAGIVVVSVTQHIAVAALSDRLNEEHFVDGLDSKRDIVICFATSPFLANSVLVLFHGYLHFLSDI